MSFSNLNMLEKRESVFDADNSFQFFMKWIQNMGGKGTLYINLPAISNESASQVCRTVRKLSGRSFSISSLVAYQLDEVLKKHQLDPNLYSLKKNLRKMEDTPHHYISTNTPLKRVKIHLSKTGIYELEFVLANMHEQLGEHDMTVEKLIQLNLMDLLREMAHGRAENAVQTILNSLGVSKAEVKEYEQDRKEILA